MRPIGDPRATTYRFTVAALALALSAAAAASEGMWTFDNFPIEAANRELGTAIDQAWLDRVRLASVRISGCSAGFVSPEGLILTNEHCVAACVQALSTPERNHALSGFTPASREEERTCPGMTAEQLLAIEDVTARIRAAGAGLDGQALTRARVAETGRIESEACAGQAGMRCQVVPLYRGGEYKLYRFRRWDDVRLAFAPESRASSFGGDLDNFSFPRFALDGALLRAYEQGAPAASPHFFRWNPAPPAPGQPVFVSGNPGATQRLLTQAQLATIRDIVLPLDQLTTSELRGRLIRFTQENEEHAFHGRQPLFSIENVYKRGVGRMRALIDADFMARRDAAEADFRARVAADPALAAAAGDPWARLAEIQADARRLYPAYSFLEARAGGGAQLFAWANQIVRGAQERAKPAAERLPEYGEARLAAVRQQLLAARPAHVPLNELQLSWWLSTLREVLTVDDPRVRQVLGTESPEALAGRLAAGTRLGDRAERERLWEGGLAAVEASDDPLVRFVVSIQPVMRAARAEYEERVETPTAAAAEVLANARFAIYGTSIYPDATGTLRLTYGRIEGWTHEGRTVPAITTFAGLWERATGSPPFDVAPRLAAARDRIRPETVLNVAASTDTIAGSSGSPAINAAGEIIGANFDSTVLTQRNAYGYDPAVNRSVLVTAAAITAAMRHAYGVEHLLAELGVPPEPAPRRRR